MATENVLRLEKCKRKVSMSHEEVIKQKLETQLAEDGWTHGTGATYWEKQVEMTLLVRDHHPNGGPPQLGEVTWEEVEELWADIQSAADDSNMTPAEFVNVINNGLYLFFNAKTKPKPGNDSETLMARFHEKATPEELRAYVGCISKKKMTEYVKAWAVKHPA